VLPYSRDPTIFEIFDVCCCGILARQPLRLNAFEEDIRSATTMLPLGKAETFDRDRRLVAETKRVEQYAGRTTLDGFISSSKELFFAIYTCFP
jgi:hypothetical protein